MNIFYRYGMTKEKPLFEKEENKKFFSGMVLPAHIMLDQSESLPEWLAINNIKYFIDPVTFIFNEENAKIYGEKENGQKYIRRSYKKYIKALNLEEIDFINETLSADYFKKNREFDNDKITSFAKAFLDLQINTMKLDDETRELLEFLKEQNIGYPLESILDQAHSPMFFMTPGFFIDSPTDKWFEINIKLIEETIKLAGNKDVFGYLPIGKECFKVKFIDKIVENLPEGLKGVVVWFEDFDDILATESELNFVASLINKLSQKNLQVINLYGGFFSALLCKIGCIGYSSGLCYDTSRTRYIEPGGGPVPFRYYSPEINKFLWKTSAESLYRIISNSCKCDVCQTKKSALTKNGRKFDLHLFIKSFFDYNKKLNGDYMTHENMLKKHYMYSIKKQMDKLKKEDVKIFLEEKRSIYEEIVNLRGANIANEYASHIPKWNNVLKKFS